MRVERGKNRDPFHLHLPTEPERGYKTIQLLSQQQGGNRLRSICINMGPFLCPSNKFHWHVFTQMTQRHGAKISKRSHFPHISNASILRLHAINLKHCLHLRLLCEREREWSKKNSFGSTALLFYLVVSWDQSCFPPQTRT